MIIPKTIAQNRLTAFIVLTLSLQIFIYASLTLIYGAKPFTSAWNSKFANYQQTTPSTAEQVQANQAIAAVAIESLEAQPENQAPAASASESAIVQESATTAPQATAPITSNTQEEPVIAKSLGTTVIHKVAPGDTMTKIWKTHGATVIGAIAADRAIKKLGASVPSLRLGEKIQLIISEQNEIIYFSRKLKNGQELVVEGNSQDGYTARYSAAEVVTHQRTASGQIFNSFAEAAAVAAVPYKIVDELVDLFSTRVEFRRDIHKGDSFSVIYSEKRLANGDFIAVGDIKAASIKVDNNMYVAVRHESKSGEVRYFDENGEPLGNYFLRYPLQFSRISSAFSTARFHPALHRTRAHNGVDFAAPTGTPVRSVADGLVVASGYSGQAGNMIKIQHDGRYSTAYLHLSKISPLARKGYKVKRGQVIGAVGATGLATGPHLHFSLFENNRYVNPMTAKLPKMPYAAERIAAGYLQATLKTLRDQHQQVQVAALKTSNNLR